MGRVLRVGVIMCVFYVRGAPRPSLGQYRCMYNFDGYFLLVSSSTMTYTQLPTVLVGTVGILQIYMLHTSFFVPRQIVYESLLATEGDAAVRHGCARRSRQRALHRDALHCASQRQSSCIILSSALPCRIATRMASGAAGAATRAA